MFVSEYHYLYSVPGAYLATKELQNFESDNPREGKTPNLKICNFAGIVKQIIYIWVYDPAEFKSGLNFELLH